MPDSTTIVVLVACLASPPPRRLPPASASPLPPLFRKQPVRCNALDRLMSIGVASGKFSLVWIISRSHIVNRSLLQLI
ncbi:hypothetical protein GUJ93_ZPchr0001g29711 [Zizania palustris]|uniref:Uncharacterized protein n=1 Tax=Zizania palustris TaxID=103762 RepID=A0A8J5RXK5_ZIZPA|nr:hypothetical protein GUJ93_ZPchr0001g29711 [Zizania palustris]